ncbi:MAG: hypothetical protein WCC59_06460, partial [Terriglobales bacterium]
RVTEALAAVLAFTVGGAVVWLLRAGRGRSELAALESGVLVSARGPRELGAGNETVDVEAIEPVERVPRGLQAVELSIQSDGNER